MNNEINKKPKYHNRFIVPVFSIAFFVILTMTVSFGYFTWWGTVGITNAISTDAYPSKCTLSVSSNSATLSIAREVLQQRPLASQIIASSNISAVITLNGPNTCQCTYTVKVKQTGAAYATPSYSERSLKFTVAGITSAASPNIVHDSHATEVSYDTNGCSAAGMTGTIAAGCTVGDGTIKVITGGTPVSHVWFLDSRVYYLSGQNQIDIAGKNFSYELRLVLSSCTF